MEIPTLISYLGALRGSRNGATREVDVPIGHAVSLPLPTLRFGMPAYATFASPAVREPEKLVVQGPPDRWWLLDARSGTVAIFALCVVHPFAKVQFTKVTLPRPAATVAELRQELKEIQAQLDTLAPLFLRGEQGEAEARHKLHRALMARIPQVLWPQYEALAPDFLAWLAT